MINKIEKTMLQVRVAMSTRRNIEKLAKLDNRSTSNYVEVLLLKEIEKNKDKLGDEDE